MAEGRSAQLARDEHLLEAALGDRGCPAAREAISQLFGRYAKRVYNWCYRYVRDHETALDLSQEVFMNAYRNLGSFQGDATFSTWLYSIARNRCLNELRRPPVVIDEEVEVDRLVGAQDDPEETYLQRLDEEAFLELMREHLGAEEQEVLWLRCVERMPIEAITELLAIRQASGARGVLQRARRRLRAALAQRRVGSEKDRT